MTGVSRMQPTTDQSERIIAAFRKEAEARAERRWWRNMALVLLFAIAAALASIFVPIIRWAS